MSLFEFFRAGGFVMWPLLLLSLGSVAVIIERIVAYKSAPAPAQIARQASEAQIERDSQKLALELERNLPLLSATAALAPLLGLLGTVTGMISTFNALATARQDGNADRVLSGIGEALYATASGIFIALVALAAYSFFTARLRRILAEIEWEASKLETQVAP